MSNPRSQKKNKYSRPTCPRYGKKHEGRCLVGRNGCYGLGKSGHMMMDFRKSKANVREGNQVATNSEDCVPKDKARFFALKSKGDQE